MTSISSPLLAPSQPPVDIANYPKLDRKQAGHLRHFHNLVSQRDGDWHHFGSIDGHQELDEAYRYQLATMAYATSVAHYHRLPALQGAFKTLLRRIIHKMLLRQVWGYWFNTSQSGRLFDPDLPDLRKPWADPVIQENIMYSGHLLLMVSLYAMLFDDDEFEKEGGLTFRWDPIAWGRKENFCYDTQSLQKVIFKQMEENDWVGVCCEPNAVFVVCNQFPIVAMRYNDVRHGTEEVREVLKKYKAALVKKGMIGSDGLYASWYAMRQQKAIPPRQGTHTAWANAFMNTWNSDEVRARYDNHVMGFLTDFDGKTRLNASRVALAFRKLVSEDGADPRNPDTLDQARKICHKFVSPVIPFETISWVTFTMMLSELGKKKELNDLLDYADTHLMPTWENGGLYYPRNDQIFDNDYNMIHMEPHSGNSGLGYARLNIEDGQKKMWERPWTREILRSRPYIDGVTFADGVDFLRGIWDESAQAMIVTLRSWSDLSSNVALGVRNLPNGPWAVYVNGKLENTIENTEVVEVAVTVGTEDVDIIVFGMNSGAHSGQTQPDSPAVRLLRL